MPNDFFFRRPSLKEYLIICFKEGIFNFPGFKNDENDLIQYLQKQSPEVLQRVAKSASEDIQEIIRHNVQGLLGMLPSDQFDVKITSSKDNIANLLSSAMMTGYFLRQMEQRKELEQTLKSDEDMSIEEE